MKFYENVITISSNYSLERDEGLFALGGCRAPVCLGTKFCTEQQQIIVVILQNNKDTEAHKLKRTQMMSTSYQTLAVDFQKALKTHLFSQLRHFSAQLNLTDCHWW